MPKRAPLYGHVIGEGVEALKEWIRKCRAAGGRPLIVTKYVEEYTNAVVVRCWGAGEKVKGGTILNIPPHIIQKIEQTRPRWKALFPEEVSVVAPRKVKVEKII